MGGQTARYLVAVGVAVVVTTTAVGCVAGGGADTRPGAAELPVADINPVPREELSEGGTLRWGIGELPTQWNPHHAGGNLIATRTVLEALLPRPFLVDADGEVRPNPAYVLEHEVSDGDPQVVTLRLNPDAVWSTGEPITWRDYAAMAEALPGAEPDFQIGGTVGYDRVASVEAGADEHEVVVTFDEPFAEYTRLFYLLLPAEYTSDAELFNEGYLDEIPVTAGPFALAEIDRTARTVTLERDGDWWGEPAVLDSIIFRVLEPTAFEGAFLDGSIDTYQVPLDPGAYERASGAADGEIRRSQGPEYRQLTLNGQSSALAEAEVRHAVFLGVDRRTLAEAALGGVDVPVDVLGNRLLLPHVDGYADNSDPWGEHDPERAAELLDAAGWDETDADGIRHRDGEPLSLNLVLPRGHGPAATEAELLTDMLADIGVEVVAEEVAGDALFPERVLPGNFDLVLFNYNHGVYPLAESMSQWLDAAVDPDGEEQWGNNAARIGSPEIDAELERALGALDPQERVEHINAVDELLWEAGHTLPLYQRPVLFAARDTLANIGAGGSSMTEYEDIGYTE